MILNQMTRVVHHILYSSDVELLMFSTKAFKKNKVNYVNQCKDMLSKCCESYAKLKFGGAVQEPVPLNFLCE